MDEFNNDTTESTGTENVATEAQSNIPPTEETTHTATEVKPKRDRSKAAKAAAGAKRSTKVKEEAPKPSHLVNATLPKRQCRVVFKVGSKIVATSPTYNSGNTIDNIISYARRKVEGASKEGVKSIFEQMQDNGKFKPVKA